MEKFTGGSAPLKKITACELFGWFLLLKTWCTSLLTWIAFMNYSYHEIKM